ncbi:Proteinase inhibitor I3, Kunitz legume [Sesbania bispinosa]|nr:Proteinase inhibitor I3, Kunitz legume [Sesbania bispinosa]
MKPTLLLTLSFLFSAFTTYLPLAFSQGEIDVQVKDIKGNPIFSGSKIYIVSAIRGAGGGGVTLGQIGESTCPVTVVQEPIDIWRGLPLHFDVPGFSPGPGIIFTNVTALNIEFEEKPECAESSKWVVVAEIGKIFPQQWVGIGGVGDHPGKKIIDGKFYIQIYEDWAYKLVFCSTNGHVCSNIGRFERRLILINDDSFPVVFVDADAIDESSV